MQLAPPPPADEAVMYWRTRYQVLLGMYTQKVDDNKQLNALLDTMRCAMEGVSGPSKLPFSEVRKSLRRDKESRAYEAKIAQLQADLAAAQTTDPELLSYACRLRMPECTVQPVLE